MSASGTCRFSGSTNSSVSLAYVGDRGKNLTRNYNANQNLFDLPNATRADLIGAPNVNSSFTPGGNDGTNIPYLANPNSAFALPAATLFPDGSVVFNAPGTAGRDILLGPGSSNIDLALFKNFALGERFRLEARVQAYNLTNTPHFANPNSVLGQWDVQGCNPATSG
jgi:hypothetical protein